MPSSQDAKTILIVDDENSIVTYLEMLFQDNGYKTISASNGEDAMEKMNDVMPDLVTLDISMPEKTGVRFLKELKSNPDRSSIPVVVITGVTGYAGDPYGYMKFISKQSNVPEPDAFFPKPIVKEELLKEIKNLLA